ncbi:CBU_0585 family protein [Francisella sp. SYW-9]|uniref:CBU_0585 family protein n=1 Tax=Francisella sp. SYW-9 TaxID=2610888 RepID=UPI00123E10D1|nr:CBU_0585 family protein [Francisella sp. SYW-9]
MMKLILRLAHLFDNKKDRAYVSEADKLLQEFDNTNPNKSESQKKEILKHRNLYKREAKPKTSFLDG